MSQAGPGTSAPEVRNAVAFITAEPDPHVTAEVQELERRGQPVLLIRIGGGQRTDARAGIEPLDVPVLSAPIIASIVARLLHNPRSIFRLALRLMGGAVAGPAGVRALLSFP